MVITKLNIKRIATLPAKANTPLSCALLKVGLNAANLLADEDCRCAFIAKRLYHVYIRNAYIRIAYIFLASSMRLGLDVIAFD